MKLTWIGHSRFKVESEGYTIILDPYGEEGLAGRTEYILEKEVEAWAE